MALLLVITTFFLNLMFPHVIGVGFEDKNVPVITVSGEEVPDYDNVFGMNTDNPSMLFVAHDMYSGKTIEEMKTMRRFYLLYSNGMRVKYDVLYYVVIDPENPPEWLGLYQNPEHAIFQTCEGDQVLIVATKRAR